MSSDETIESSSKSSDFEGERDDSVENNESHFKTKVKRKEKRKMAGMCGNIERWFLNVQTDSFFCPEWNEDDKKKDVVAIFGGADSFKILHSLVQPATIESKTFDELIVALYEHFAPECNETAESFKFNKTDEKFLTMRFKVNSSRL